MLRSVVGWALAGALCLTAYVSVVVAIGIALARSYGAVPALVILAALTLVLAGIILVIVGMLNRQTEKIAEARRREAARKLPDPMTLQLLASVPALMRGRSLLTTGVIAGLAYMMLRSGGTRRDRD